MEHRSSSPGFPSGTIRVAALALAILLAGGCSGIRVAPDSRPAADDRAPAPPAAESGEPAAPGETESRRDAALEDAFYAVLEEQLAAELIPGEGFSDAPHDELGEISPALSPEELARERGVVEALVPTFDIPMVTNDKVLAWVDHYANRRADTFEPGLVRSGRYLAMFREIFAEAGLPQDLVYMAHVESAYKTTAYSRARAKGIFQFIAATGKRYGLHIDYWVDERADPEQSARAATRYLKDLYDEFGDWYLALAGYNAGEGRVRRAIRLSGTKDFWKQGRYYRRETRNYVPAILAAILISKDPAKYGFAFEPEEPLEYESVDVDGAVDLNVLARCAGTDFETLDRLNPALRRNQTPPNATTAVHVPIGVGPTMRAELKKVPRGERVLYARHKVRRGDTLYELARAYGVSVSAIQHTNRMGRRTMIRIGQELVIPTASAGSLPAGAAPYDAPAGQLLSYRVRRGDTLSGISRRYSTSAAAIAAASGISIHKTLQIGEWLKVVPGVRSSAQARRISSEEADGSVGDEVASHKVRRGDTLWRIAERYNTTVGRLCRLNGISPKATLYPGTVLNVR